MSADTLTPILAASEQGLAFPAELALMLERVRLRGMRRAAHSPPLPACSLPEIASIALVAASLPTMMSRSSPPR